jgi:hypothetical protein
LRIAEKWAVNHSDLGGGSEQGRYVQSLLAVKNARLFSQLIPQWAYG